MDKPLFKPVVYMEEESREELPDEEVDYRCIECGAKIDCDSYPYCPPCWDEKEGFS